MGIFEKFTNILSNGDDYSDADYGNGAYDNDVYRNDEPSTLASSETILAHEPVFQKEHSPQPQQRPSKVVSLGKQGQTEMRIANPQDMNDSDRICSWLTENCTVICNFENTDDRVTQRIIDYISGACYVLGGEIRAVSQRIFVVTPRSVNLLQNDFEQDDESYDDYGYEDYRDERGRDRYAI